ncbi:hypothetical protein AAHT66_03775 [Bacillus inaquosorum]
MFNNQFCTIVSSFQRGNKYYVTLELDTSNVSSNNFIPTPESDIEIGNFRIEVNQTNGKYEISLYYGDYKIHTWTIDVPENACVSLGDQSFTVFGLGVTIKNIQICLENGHVCLKGDVYVNIPIFGETFVDSINVCS